MEKIHVTRHDYVEHGKNDGGDYTIALFFRNHTERFNGREFLTHRLYKSALSSLKKHLKTYKDKSDDLFLDKESCQEIERFFDGLETGF